MNNQKPFRSLKPTAKIESHTLMKLAKKRCSTSSTRCSSQFWTQRNSEKMDNQRNSEGNCCKVCSFKHTLQV